MKKNLLTLKHLATATQGVQEIVAGTKITAAIKAREDIILAIRVDVGAVDTDAVDNTMQVEVATLVGETDQPRSAYLLKLKHAKYLYLSCIQEQS